MGGCNCKKRKLAFSHNIQLLPSKLCLTKLVREGNFEISKNNLYEEVIPTEDKVKTRRRSSMTDQHEKDCQYDSVVLSRRSSSLSNLSDCSTSPKIIIQQNIIIKPRSSNCKNDELVNGNEKTHNVERPVSVTKYIKLNFVGRNSLENNFHYEGKISIHSNTSNEPSNNSSSETYIVKTKTSKNRSAFESVTESNKKVPEACYVPKPSDNFGNTSSIHEKSLRNPSANNEENDTSTTSTYSFLNTACFFNDTKTKDDSQICNSSNCSDENSKDIRNETKEMRCDSESTTTADQAYVDDICNTEYLDEIFNYLRTLESKTVLKKNFLKKCNNSNQMLRSETINWMLKIQADLNFSNSEFYIAVLLFDKVLASIHVPGDVLKLVALSVIWIVIKFYGSDNVSASLLVHLSQQCYTIDQLVEMEENVLEILNFDVNVADPTICVTYYVKLLNIQYDNLTRLSVAYALDLLCLLPEFSSTPSSVTAAAVLSFILSIYSVSTKVNIYNFFKKILSLKEIRKMNSLEVLLYIQLKNMTDKNYLFKEPYHKYKTGNRMSVAEFLKDIV